MIALASNKVVWTHVKLNEICRPKQWPTISQKQLKETGYPVFGANGIIGYYDSYTHEKPTILITCRGATCGTINLSLPKSYVTGNAMALDQLDETRVSQDYLRNFLDFRGLADVISGSAQPQITRQTLSKVAFQLPPLEEQRRIAEILDLADGLRVKRREALAEVEGLTEAVFYEFLESENWDLVSLKDSVQIEDGDRGKSYPSQDEFAPSGFCLFLSAKNVTKTGFMFENVQFISQQRDDALRKGKAQYDDVILTTRGTLGNAALYNRDITFPEVRINSGMVLLRPELTRLNPNFLYYVVSSTFFEEQIHRSQSGSAQPQLPIRTLEKLNIPLPPLRKQEEFVDRMKAIEKLKASHQRSLEEMDALFASLQSRAFKGEL